MRFLILTRSILLCLCLLGLAAVANAQDEDLSLDSSTDYIFGKELQFNLEGGDLSDVERITLFFRPQLSTELYLVDVPFESGKTLTVTHTVDIALINLKPFSRISYYWELETGNGTLSFPEQTFAYEDDRFAWQQMTRSGATVHWTGNGPSFGQDVLNVVDEALLNLSTLLPLESISPFDVYVYPSAADLREAVEMAGNGGEESLNPDLDVILVTAVNPQSAVSDLGQSIPPELAQLLISREAGDNYDSFPWWLAEGLGYVVQSRLNPSFQQRLNEAVGDDSTIPLWQLCSAPLGTSDRATLARAQSWAVVAFIEDRFGEQRLTELVRSYARGTDCLSGVEDVLGISLDQLQEAWLDAYREPSAIVIYLSEFGLWIVMILAGFGLALLLVRYSIQGSK